MKREATVSAKILTAEAGIGSKAFEFLASVCFRMTLTIYADGLSNLYDET